MEHILICSCAARGCSFCPKRVCAAPTAHGYFSPGPLQHQFAGSWCSTSWLTKHVKIHHHFVLTKKVFRSQVAEEVIPVCSRWTLRLWPRGGLGKQIGLNFFICQGLKGTQPPLPEPAMAPFSPHHLTAPPSHEATFPSKSSHISCQELDLLQPVWWRPQPQTGWYFYHFCLAPVSCLLAGGGGGICWYLVLSFLTQTRLPHCTRTETITSKLPDTRPPTPGPLVFAPSPRRLHHFV